MAVSLRPSREEDLAELVRIQYRALGFERHLEKLALDHVTPLIRHCHDYGKTIVAESDGRLAGFAAGHERDGTWFLGEFFVNPDLQLGGIGQRLLTASVPSGIPIATVATEDLRAQGLYARFGMTPRWPSYNLEAKKASISSLPPTNLEVHDADVDDAAWAAWDQTICGRYRWQALDFQARHWNGSRYWIARAGRRVGYGAVSRRAPGRATIGPVGALSPVDAAECVLAMVHHTLADPEVDTVMLDVPGPHPALPVLLSGGFIIDELNVFCASDPARFGDPRRYVQLSAALC